MSQSLQASEAECAAVAKAPRVALDDIAGAISETYYAQASGVFGPPDCAHLTLCLIVMKNGFMVVGKSAPASPENFNAELGRKLAYEDCIRQLWPLMGFALRDKLSRQ